MTGLPKYIKDFPNVDTTFPFHLGINSLDHGYPSHRHDFLEFSYVIEGEGTETINGIPHQMRPGTFTFVLPYQIHEIHTLSKNPLRLYNCMFGISFILERNPELMVFLEEGIAHLPSHILLDNKSALKMTELLKEMHEEYRKEQLWRSTLINAKLTEVLITFDRYRQSRLGTGLTEPETRRPLDKTIWHIIHYVYNHYQQNITLSSTADRFHYNASYLSELFKKKTGQNFVGFLHDVRIRHACGLLRSTEMNVLDIALEIGYPSYKSFSRIFKEIKGVSPLKYRKSPFVSKDLNPVL